MNRRGVVIIVVLACLAVAGGLFLVLAQQVVTERRQVQDQQRSVQAQWLAEAGLERAVARLAKSADYTGETWNIPADEIAGGKGGVVRIRTETIAGRPESRTIHVEADYPDDPQHHCRQVKQIVADIAKK